MSAWLVSDNHIRLIVQGLKLYSGMERPADAVCSDLYRENCKSVSYRYDRRERPHKIEYHPVMTDEGVDIRPLVLKAIDCYQYQSCEHPGWESSYEKRITDELEKDILATYPQPLPMTRQYCDPDDPPYVDKDKLPGYAEAPWGFE